jgi:hypothetical protein
MAGKIFRQRLAGTTILAGDAESAVCTIKFDRFGRGRRKFASQLFPQEW